MSIKKILCAHDLTPASEPALALALRLARQLAASLVVVHVAAQPNERARAFGIYSVEEMELLTGFARREQVAAAQILQDKLAQANPPANDAVVCEVVVRQGHPRDVLNVVATAKAADLIVVGTHARRGLSHLVLGSVAEHLVRSAPCPVLVARPTESAA